MREIVHIQAGQCGNQIGAKVSNFRLITSFFLKIKTDDTEIIFLVYLYLLYCLLINLFTVH